MAEEADIPAFLVAKMTANIGFDLLVCLALRSQDNEIDNVASVHRCVVPSITLTFDDLTR
jgi:hypothetical protein